MGNDTPDINTATLEQLLDDLTTAKLEKREDEIAVLQEEIGRRQAAGETMPARDSEKVATNEF